MLTIRIANLNPFSSRLHGATIGDQHAAQIRERIVRHAQPAHFATLDFDRVEGASASYLKRLFNPFYASPGDPEGFPREIAPVLVNIQSTDLKEEIDDYLAGKNRVLIVADLETDPPRFRQLLGHLDGAAAETFQELQVMKKSTAAELYERHRTETTNQTAWNNRLVQLVEMRIARRRRDGRFWIYEPTVQS